jgi:hypothetical protein
MSLFPNGLGGSAPVPRPQPGRCGATGTLRHLVPASGSRVHVPSNEMDALTHRTGIPLCVRNHFRMRQQFARHDPRLGIPCGCKTLSSNRMTLWLRTDFSLHMVYTMRSCVPRDGGSSP